MSKSIKLKNNTYWDYTSLNQKTITLTNNWLMGYKALGDNFAVIIPFVNPRKNGLTINLTNSETFTGNGWETITYSGYRVYETFILITFSTDASIENGKVYLTRLEGTISI